MKRLVGSMAKIADITKFEEGRSLWMEYVRINGYAFIPNAEGLSRLSKSLDLNIPYIRKCINTYLEA